MPAVLLAACFRFEHYRKPVHAAGRGALTLGTLRPLPTEPLHIPPLCLGGYPGAARRRCRCHTAPAPDLVSSPLLVSVLLLCASHPSALGDGPSVRCLDTVVTSPAPQPDACLSRTTQWSTWTSRGRRPLRVRGVPPPAPLRRPWAQPLCPARRMRSRPAGACSSAVGRCAEAAMLPSPPPLAPAPPRPACLLAGGGAFAEQTAWPEFHNGVAAGLRLAPGTHQLTRTWVVYNKPSGGARCWGGKRKCVVQFVWVGLGWEGVARRAGRGMCLGLPCEDERVQLAVGHTQAVPPLPPQSLPTRTPGFSWRLASPATWGAAPALPANPFPCQPGSPCGEAGRRAARAVPDFA